MKNLNNIPDELKKDVAWVCAWKNSKIPMRAFEKRGASSVIPETWSSFELAKHRVDSGDYDDVGYVFHNTGLVGIDIDDGFTEDGFLSELSVDIINRCNSYTEKSRSGTGIHIILKGDLPFNGKNNRTGVEIYKSNRYFIMTGDKILRNVDKIVENQEAIDYVIEKYFPETDRESTDSNGVNIYSTDYEFDEDSIVVKPMYPSIPNGMRNISLTSLAGQLHMQRFNKSIIYNELMHVNKVACTPSLSEREVANIVESITRYRR